MPSRPVRRLAAHRVGDAGALSRRPGRRSACSRGGSSAPPRPARRGRGPSRPRSALPRSRSPGRDGITTSNASSALPPWAVGSVSGPMTSSISMTEPGPAVRDDQRQRVLVLRPDVDEVDVEPVDLGRELRERVELRLEPAPSRSRSPSSARAPGASPAARPASRPRPSPCSGQRVAGDAPAQVVELVPLGTRRGRAGCRWRSRRWCS